MEFKHFSHNHGLVFHQIPQGSDVRCSGCKFPGSGNIYACWQCNYFLHEQCFRAARSFKHPSHPLHPLTLVPFPTYPSGSFFCNSCSHAGDGFSYSCSACEFDIHVHCAHLSHNNASQHASPSPVPGQDFHSQSQTCNPIYPPPIQISAYPAYPPHNPTQIPNDIQSYPPHNPTLIPNETQNYPPQAYPPIPNTSFPNQTQNYPSTPHMPENTGYTPPPQTTPTAPTYSTVVNATTTTPPPPPPPQPNPAYPTYNTAGNTNTTANTPPPPPAAPIQSDNVPPPKPPSIIKHFSHPHVLKPMEIEKQNAKVCSACECELSGSSVCCTEPHCKFNVHKTCFDSPIEITHKSHLQHPLKLLPSPPYEDGFTCNACLKDGKAFAYTCSTCSYDLHIDCVRWPDTVIRPDHKHNLTLYYSSPAAAEAGQEVTFICDVCTNPVHEMAWVYYCRECDFGTHLECVASGIKQQSGGSGGTTAEEELKIAVLQMLIAAQGRQNCLDSI